MTAGEISLIVTAVVGGVGALATAVVTLIKGWGFWRRGSVQILTAYIRRITNELEVVRLDLVHNQEALDELFGLHFECEAREAQYYSWMERAVERMVRDGNRLKTLGADPEPLLQLPPKRAVDRGKRYEAYLRKKIKHNEKKAEMVYDKPKPPDESPEGNTPKTY